MTDAELLALVPTSKHDMEKARRIIALGWPAALPILPSLLAWLQDMNWPVAQELQPFIAQAGTPLVPEIRRVLAGDDIMWKYWLIYLVPHCASDVQAVLRPDLEQLASGDKPEDEDAASVWEAARDVLGQRS